MPSLAIHPKAASPPRSAAPTQPSRLTRSRRRRWLSQHPEYFAKGSADLELADPLSYDRLIRQHQSAGERQSEGARQGWARTLESSLVRGEAKLAELREEPAERGTDWSIAADDAKGDEGEAEAAKEHAAEQWREMIAQHFIAGHDDAADYVAIDADDSLDLDDGLAGGWAERRRQEEWFDDEAERTSPDGPVVGQTGVQDF